MAIAMITHDGWFDWARREPGPLDKVYSDRCRNVGMIPHSMEGRYSDARSRLFSTQRDGVTGRYTEFAAASWTGSLLNDGTLIQHYSVFASCWASGARFPNTSFPAFECEGRAGSPLNAAQVDTLRGVKSELSAHFGWKPRRPTTPTDTTASLYEHNECTRWGARATACPSGRIPWASIMEDEGYAMNIAAWWSGDDGKGRLLAPGPPGTIDLVHDFGAAKVYDLRLVLAPDSPTGTIIFRHGEGPMENAGGGSLLAGRVSSFMLIASPAGTAKFVVTAPGVKVAYLACAGIIA